MQTYGWSVLDVKIMELAIVVLMLCLHSIANYVSRPGLSYRWGAILIANGHLFWECLQINQPGVVCPGLTLTSSTNDTDNNQFATIGVTIGAWWSWKLTVWCGFAWRRAAFEEYTQTFPTETRLSRVTMWTLETDMNYYIEAIRSRMPQARNHDPCNPLEGLVARGWVTRIFRQNQTIQQAKADLPSSSYGANILILFSGFVGIIRSWNPGSASCDWLRLHMHKFFELMFLSVLVSGGAKFWSVQILISRIGFALPLIISNGSNVLTIITRVWIANLTGMERCGKEHERTTSLSPRGSLLGCAFDFGRWVIKRNSQTA